MSHKVNKYRVDSKSKKIQRRVQKRAKMMGTIQKSLLRSHLIRLRNEVTHRIKMGKI